MRLLDERGAFVLRRAVDDIADRMRVSRITIYNYLNAITAVTRRAPRFDVIGFDADDTLWHSEDSFHDVERRYVELLAPYVADGVDVRAALRATERRAPADLRATASRRSRCRWSSAPSR